MKEASCIPQGTEIERTGFHYTLSLIGGKYKMAVLYLLAEHDALRHNELHRRITGISFKTLASVLRALARDGLVVRTEYPQIPPKVEYALTQRGRSLIPILYMMCDWGERHRSMRNPL
ncbi:MAG: winged helix-turn-helix transcriptional regulator [Selenomonas artemidis]